MRQFEELEALMTVERKAIDHQRKLLALDRQKLALDKACSTQIVGVCHLFTIDCTKIIRLCDMQAAFLESKQQAAQEQPLEP